MTAPRKLYILILSIYVYLVYFYICLRIFAYFCSEMYFVFFMFISITCFWLVARIILNRLCCSLSVSASSKLSSACLILFTNTPLILILNWISENVSLNIISEYVFSEVTTKVTEHKDECIFHLIVDLLPHGYCQSPKAI